MHQVCVRATLDGVGGAPHRACRLLLLLRHGRFRISQKKLLRTALARVHAAAGEASADAAAAGVSPDDAAVVPVGHATDSGSLRANASSGGEGAAGESSAQSIAPLHPLRVTPEGRRIRLAAVAASRLLRDLTTPPDGSPPLVRGRVDIIAIGGAAAAVSANLVVGAAVAPGGHVLRFKSRAALGGVRGARRWAGCVARGAGRSVSYGATRAQPFVLSWLGEPQRSEVLRALELVFESASDVFDGWSDDAEAPGRREALLLDIIAHGAGLVSTTPADAAAAAGGGGSGGGGSSGGGGGTDGGMHNRMGGSGSGDGDASADEAGRDGGGDARAAALMSAYLAVLPGPGEGTNGAGMVGGDAAVLCVRARARCGVWGVLRAARAGRNATGAEAGAFACAARCERRRLEASFARVRTAVLDKWPEVCAGALCPVAAPARFVCACVTALTRECVCRFFRAPFLRGRHISGPPLCFGGTAGGGLARGGSHRFSGSWDSWRWSTRVRHPGCSGRGACGGGGGALVWGWMLAQAWTSLRSALMP